MNRPALELVFLRHGQTAWNTERRVQGHTDRPLNPQGEAEATHTAQTIAELHKQKRFDRLLVSDLQRAIRTAELATQLIELPKAHWQVDPSWRERSFGCLEGLTHEEMLTIYPEIYAGWKSGEPDFNLPGGESLRQFHERVRSALAGLQAAHADRAGGARILVVTHGGVIDLVRRIVENQTISMPRGYDIPNCSLSTLRCYPRGTALEWQLGPWAQVEHFDETHL